MLPNDCTLCLFLRKQKGTSWTPWHTSSLTKLPELYESGLSFLYGQSNEYPRVQPALIQDPTSDKGGDNIRISEMACV